MSATSQLTQWEGDFGNAYVARNQETAGAAADYQAGFAEICARGKLNPAELSVLEVGANIGNKLRALAGVGIRELHAVEPNRVAFEQLTAAEDLTLASAHHASAFALPFPDTSVDLVYTAGVLIHIAPEDLGQACAEIVRVARRYVLCLEYFNQTPVEVPYRGKDGLLFKRDFGGFYLDEHPELRLVDYGFFWRRVTAFDDITWWLFAKPAPDA